MNILILGGSGLLGSHAAREALARQHSVTLVSRTAPQDDYAGKALRHVACDLHDVDRESLRGMMAGQDALVYSLGMDDRFPLDYPAYDGLFQDHVVRCRSIVSLAKEYGIKRCVVYGSYFTYLDKALPQYRLGTLHPYIRTRELQRTRLLELADADFQVFVFELPYIIGSLPGRIPPWSFLFAMLDSKPAFFFKRGGTAVVTAQQVATATVNALEGYAPSGSYPVVGDNVSWVELAEFFYREIQRKPKFLALPIALFMLYGLFESALNRVKGKQRGLAIQHFAAFQYAQAYIDPKPSIQALGYPASDYRPDLARMIASWKQSRA